MRLSRFAWRIGIFHACSWHEKFFENFGEFIWKIGGK